MAVETAASSGNNYSLVAKFAPQLSRHLFLHLIEFESQRAQQNNDEAAMRNILEAKFELMKDTNMADYVANMYCQLHGVDNAPEEYAQKRQAVLAQLETSEAETSKISDLLMQEEVVDAFRSDKVANLQFLEKNHGVTIDMVNGLYEHGIFHFRCGNYADAADLLYKFRILSTDDDMVSKATWGKLACEILVTNWEQSWEEITRIREIIDSKLFNNPRAQLDHRTMLIHWSLFPLFNDDKNREPILEMLLSPNFINTIQTTCPWILRYLVAAVITGRSRARSSSVHQKQMKDIVRYVRQELYEYQDPVIEFISALYLDFEFDAAREALRKSEEVCQNDFFLLNSTDAFVEAARHLICESYFKVSSLVSIHDLSEKLGLNPDDGEKWIVKLIYESRIDAKIDAQAGTITINQMQNNVHQQIVEKTKGVIFRTSVMSTALSK
ncbi:Eukaryotic translation initiation factor 3 subunit E [Ceratocystis fimbriata CBS 114723]|uniref:Eukaryotic translation initiation factor 3 subunit E n=1 Tax=Ceratocystis fimbriata CBS 114723 TaxID=1035309 RepID=A0A2C5WXM1_9PEZI|nr:Eukaryotic translation initiation factor 3 subunit E [Ceratocystis fimbriata CBS 114723]